MKTRRTRMQWRWILVVVAGLAAGPTSGRCGEPGSAAELLTHFSETWREDAWGPPGRRRYIRPLEDKGWRTRMLALRGLAASGQEAVGPLVEALAHGDAPARILAAQALGYLAPHAPQTVLQRALESDPEPAVRLYAADSLGMQGGEDLTELLTRARDREKSGDVRKHIGYALERGGQGVEPAVLQALTGWRPERIDTARVGSPAPDFQLSTVGGQQVRLSQFRGRSPVVLVFIYGDT